MTMSGHARGATEKSRRSDSNASTTSKPNFTLASHSQPTRTTSHASTNGSRNGHAITASSSKSFGSPAGSIDTPAEHSVQGKQHSNTYPLAVNTIEEEYQENAQRSDETRRHHHSNLTNSNGNGNGNSTSSSSSFSKNDAKSTGRIGHIRSENGSSSGPSAADANFRAGLKLIQQAYEDKYQALVEEVNTWKWISEEQSAQMTVMAAELARVEDSYAALQKEMAQLEMFRKAIVSMVDQHSGVSLSQLEQSILETIEADAENGDAGYDAGYDAVADADTSSFILDDGAESIAPLSQQQRFSREDIILRDQKAANASTMSILPSFKSSPQFTLSRPRASTEASAKRSGTAQHTSRQPVSSQSSYSPSRQSGSSAVRSGTGVLSDSAQNGVKKIQKSDAVDSLRSKRNTISTSSRPIYPNTFLSAGTTAKRHSSVSPLSPRAQAIIASSRATATSTSFSSNSTPSTSPRQPISSTSGSTTTGTMAARAARQSQPQKEYIGVRNSMSHMASLSGVAPLSSQGSRRHAITETTSVQPKASNSGNSQTIRRSQRSGSDTLSVNGLSPAALKLLRQQEKQQLLEEENEYAQKSSAHNRHGSHHNTDDEDHRRSIAYAQARSSVNGGSRVHQQNASDPGHENNVHPPTGYESSSKYQKEGAQHRQSATYGEKANARATGTSNGNRPPQSTSYVDASAFTMLYKDIRDSMDTSSFGMFARVVTSFNEGEKTTDETLDEVGKIVKDRALNQRFRDLIHQAIAEKESQQGNEAGNETMEGDLTLEIDQSLLLDDDSVVVAQDRAQALEYAYEALSREKDDEREVNSIQNPDESMLQGDERDEGEVDQSMVDGRMLESDKILGPRKDMVSGDESGKGNTENGINGALQSTRQQTI